jgi:nucleoid-associated protein YgaU
MATIPFAKLQKLKITSYPDDEFDNGDGEFTAMYNPTELSLQFGQQIVENKVDNAKLSAITAKGLNNGKFTVDLFFDGTGASNSGGIAAGILGGIAALKDSFVKDEIKKFFAITLRTDKKTHDSRYLEVEWGAGFFFACKLESASVKYLLFSKSGNPLRATLNASFIQVPSNKDDTHSEKQSFLSPDVTKIHTVKSGDTIYNIAKKEYESESFYLKIAEVNDLKNYRKLVPGQKLILPAVKKSN